MTRFLAGPAGLVLLLTAAWLGLWLSVLRGWTRTGLRGDLHCLLRRMVDTR